MSQSQSKYLSNEAGSIAMLAGLIMAILLMAVGFAIDYTRIIRDRQHAQQALDASLLAATVSYQGGSTKEDAKRAARNYLDANTDPSHKFDVTFEFSESSVSGQLRSSTLTPIMSVFGYRDVKWNVGGEVGYSQPPAIDYSLALDISSSMEAGGHMDALRSALEEFSTTAFEGSKPGDVSVTLVPFANGVSFPDKFTKWLKPAKGNAKKDEFVGCFEAEVLHFKASLSKQKLGTYQAAPDLVQVAQNNIFCPRPGTQISFYAETESQLSSRISSLQSYQGTATADALSWAWRTLEPDWQNEFAESSKYPREHSKDYRKVLVLLTDGLPYVRPWSEKKLSDGRKEQLRREALKDFQAVCEAIRADGRFDLYTIGYGDSMTPDESAALQGCTAGKGTFLRANKTNVSQVFKNIARTTAQIALRR